MVVKEHSLVLMGPRPHAECMNLTSAAGRSLSYSRYADLPVDRDLARISADLRALPAPTAATATDHSARRPWLQRHLHLHRAHA
jgi:hypothetical protein